MKKIIFDSFTDIFISSEFSSNNFLTSFIEGNLIQIIILAVIVGIAINRNKTKTKLIADFFISLNEVLANALNLILKFTPVGGFALFSVISGTYGKNILISLTGTAV